MEISLDFGAEQMNRTEGTHQFNPPRLCMDVSEVVCVATTLPAHRS
jgi:hypothetical protein